MGLQYEMSLFSSETVEGVEDWLLRTRPYKQGLLIFFYIVLNLYLKLKVLHYHFLYEL